MSDQKQRAIDALIEALADRLVREFLAEEQQAETVTPTIRQPFPGGMPCQSRSERKPEILKVVNAAGQRAEFIVTTQVVTEIMMDNSVVTYNKLATITTRRGEHVNRRGEKEFETLSGVRWKLVE